MASLGPTSLPKSHLKAGDLVVGIVRRPDPVPCACCAAGEWDFCRNGQFTERGIKAHDGYGSERWRVDDRFARRGIAQRLVEVSLANAVALGYRTAVTEATNLVSQHIFSKLGFATRAQASYGDYRGGGNATFASIADQGGIMSMARNLKVGG